MPTFLTEVTTGSGFDPTQIFSWVTSGLRSIMSVATDFPLNIFIGASIIGIGVGLYRSLKR